MIVRCFNVGQGNCILIELPPDEAHLEARFGIIDCFTSRAAAEPRVLTYLRNRGVRELEFIALSHPDADHCTGLSQVLKYFSSSGRSFKTYIESMYDCETVCRVNEIRKTALGGTSSTPHGEELHKIANLTSLKVGDGSANFNYESLGHAFQLLPLTDDLKLRFFAPTNASFQRLKHTMIRCMEALQSDSAPPKLDLNDSCIAFQLIYGDARILFCGDVTNKVWTEVIPQAAAAKKLDSDIDLRSDFVAVTHHGAKTGNPRALWDSIAHEPNVAKRQTVAVISCGYENPYKHPAEQTLNLLLSRKIMLFCINLGSPCHDYDVMSHKKANILDSAIAEISKTPLDRALDSIGTAIPQVCSGDVEFQIEKNGAVRLTKREQDSHCAYAADRKMANSY